MVELMLWTWAWTIAGCFALHVHSGQIKREMGLLEVAVLVVAWPWWLSHYRGGAHRSRKDNNPSVVPVRIEPPHKKPRKR